jgi:hypothetical protein
LILENRKDCREIAMGEKWEPQMGGKRGGERL